MHLRLGDIRDQQVLPGNLQQPVRFTVTPGEVAGKIHDPVTERRVSGELQPVGVEAGIHRQVAHRQVHLEDLDLRVAQLEKPVDGGRAERPADADLGDEASGRAVDATQVDVDYAQSVGAQVQRAGDRMIAPFTDSAIDAQLAGEAARRAGIEAHIQLQGVLCSDRHDLSGSEGHSLHAAV